MRSALIIIGVLSLVLSSCATVPTAQEANDAVLMLRRYEEWAWVVGIALICADLVLPIPQTTVIAALGITYGTLLGGLLGSLGLIASGLLGYGLMLTSARRFAQRFAGPRSLHKMESFFDRSGAWAIVLTRSLPYSVPEAMVFLAGLAGMPIRRFTVALTIGSVPAGFAFAAIGAGWANQPILALAVSYVLPILLLPVTLYLRPRRAQSEALRSPEGTHRMVEERVQRRLAAILAADVVGYSRLIGAEEEGTLARLRALRDELMNPTVSAYRGRIVKTTGDGILIEFASVVDAVGAALDVQCAMAARNAEIPADRRIELRMGITLGDVVVEADGDLMGDGVNVAARLEAVAEAGGICLSRSGYDQVKGKVDAEFVDLGEQNLKNIAQPVRVYRVGSSSGARAAPAAPAPE